ncbi:hypothetical protein VMB_25850 [Vibrio mimicus VM603]|uniref:Uncharacterized protein n=1 Tax=Vibrio mimicus VM603 TaxID=671074 RepID=D2YGD8_VIBMI|nr:hypothetical protein VMB_25850 [Vibrio mimicus VM603]
MDLSKIEVRFLVALLFAIGGNSYLSQISKISPSHISYVLGFTLFSISVLHYKTYKIKFNKIKMQSALLWVAFLAYTLSVSALNNRLFEWVAESLGLIILVLVLINSTSLNSNRIRQISLVFAYVSSVFIFIEMANIFLTFGFESLLGYSDSILMYEIKKVAFYTWIQTLRQYLVYVL